MLSTPRITNPHLVAPIPLWPFLKDPEHDPSVAMVKGPSGNSLRYSIFKISKPFLY
jgi:hypothetical protein